MAKKNKQLRYGLIGAGGIAGTHMDILKKFDDVKIVAIADPVEKAVKARAQTYQIEHQFNNYEQMLKEVQLDAVSVCTPNGLHAPASIAASKAGVHVLVEKPMAMNATEAQSMIDVAKKNKTKLVVGFQCRYSPNAQFIRKQVDEGRMGKVLYARTQAMRRRGIPNWGVFGRKDLQGGGPLIDIGVHALEMTHYAMGSPKPVSAVGRTMTYMGNKKSNTVSAWPNWDHKTYTVEDLAVGQIHFDTGAVLTLESSFIAHMKPLNLLTFELLGEKAGATYDPLSFHTDHGGYMMDMTPAYIPEDDFVKNFEDKVRNFVEHALYNKPTMAPAEHGLMVQKMLDAVYKSADANGKQVTIR